jgi:hypothetical protein
MSEEATATVDTSESPFAILDSPIEESAGDSAEATPAEGETEEAPSKPESEGEEKLEKAAKPDTEPATKDGEKAADEEPEPIEGAPPKLKEFLAKHSFTGEEKRWIKGEVYAN